MIQRMFCPFFYLCFANLFFRYNSNNKQLFDETMRLVPNFRALISELNQQENRLEMFVSTVSTAVHALLIYANALIAQHVCKCSAA